MTRQPVLVFDPSPTGVNTAAKTEKHNLEFFPIGLAANPGVLQFSVPADPEEGSYSMTQGNLETVSFECYDLATIMTRNGDSHIDLLKMDIEGFEFDIVNQFLDQNIPVRQLCVEFHRWFRPGRDTLRDHRRPALPKGSPHHLQAVRRLHLSSIQLTRVTPSSSKPRRSKT